MAKKSNLIRYADFGNLFEIFFYSAILTILTIRIYLQLTGFPQIGSGVFHIAHLLFGGFFMLFAIIGFMSYLNDDLKVYWSLLAGVGFGTFIDELGKFITRDNNYFFQPTIAIIYVIFVLLYLIYKNIDRDRKFTSDEYIANSANLLKNVVTGSLDRDERRKALLYLVLSGRNDAIANFLKQTFEKSHESAPDADDFYDWLRMKLQSVYRSIVSKVWFMRVVSALFVVRAILYVAVGFFLIRSFAHEMVNLNPQYLFQSKGLLQLIQFVALSVQAIITVVGAFFMAQSRKIAYLYFRSAVLVSIFVLQVFNFYSNPLMGLLYTVGDLLLLGALNYMLHQETFHMPANEYKR